MNNKTNVISALVKTGKWDKRSAMIGYEANFKCGYCDKDLLSSVDDYKSWEKDHIVPTSKSGRDEELNIILSCRTCNTSIKRAWDPRLVCSENPSREELISATKQYIISKRTEVLEDIAEFRRIIYGGSNES